MSDTSIDDLLMVVENHTRRMILKELVRERMYPLQLSRELRISQQAVMKHLRLLEEKKLVEGVVEKSDLGGPPRKRYSASRMFSITIDVGPGIFSEEVRVFQERSFGPGKECLGDTERLTIGDAVGAMRQALTELLEIESEMEEIDERRAALLQKKELLRRAAYNLAEVICESDDAKRVLTHLIETGMQGTEGVAEALDMRERRVKEVLAQFARKGLLEVMEDG